MIHLILEQGLIFVAYKTMVSKTPTQDRLDFKAEYEKW